MNARKQKISLRQPPVARAWLLAGLALAALVLAGCAEVTSFIPTPSMLDTKGPAAEQIAFTWWVMFALGGVIYLGVIGYLLWALFRRRKEQEDERANLQHGHRAILWGGIALPAVVILLLFGLTIGVLASLNVPDVPDELVVQVVGHRWWWQVDYPELQFTTANEIHIPVGQPVQFKLTSQDVIHSFWVPQLHGKMDVNPGRTNTFWLQADEPGIYWGQCAEFCGTQHAKMQFVVVAQPADEFVQWVQNQQQPAPEPDSALVEEGLQVFLDAECVYCHTIRGTEATGKLGPDLTHLASRLTLAAGTVPNTRGNLGGWISDPHGIKPGNLMPPATDMTGAELQALLAYLETLE